MTSGDCSRNIKAVLVAPLAALPVNLLSLLLFLWGSEAPSEEYHLGGLLLYSVLYTLLSAYPAFFVIGLPAIAFARSRSCSSAKSFLIGGAVIGALVFTSLLLLSIEKFDDLAILRVSKRDILFVLSPLLYGGTCGAAIAYLYWWCKKSNITNAST